MPTGYTAKIEEGISFQEFALTCARAFGATIMLRDEPLSSEIPEFEPSDYHAKKLIEAKEVLAKYEAYSQQDWEQDAEASYLDKLEYAKRRQKESDALKDKYESMLIQAKGWIPPTEEHEGLKKFMIEQIKSSINFDCGDIEMPQRVGWMQHKSNVLKSANWDISYHTKGDAEERERTNNRNTWVNQLKQSLSI